MEYPAARCAEKPAPGRRQHNEKCNRSTSGRASEKSLDPELSLSRDYTIGMLRRYFRMSIELGRLPSILGREFFRAKVTSYRMNSFEDVVILVHDVEKCINLLDPFS